MAEEKKKEEKGMPASLDNMVYFWGVGGIVLGLIIGFLVFPGMAGTTGAGAAAGAANSTFVLDQAKVANIASLLEDNIFLSNGQQVAVTYSRYVDQGDYVDIYYSIGGQEVPISVSRDYKYIYPSGAVEISAVEEQMRTLLAQAAQNATAQTAAASVPKSDDPQVLMFVMSFCPYGNQAEAGLVPVVEQLADNADFEPVYIIYPTGGECAQNNGTQYCSMHGNNELWQDVREKIIFNTYGEKKWAEYVGKVDTECSLTNIGTCWLTVANETGVDAAAVSVEFDANKFAILDAEIAKTTQYGVRSSPTILVNGYTYSGSRTPAAYQATVCEAFNSAPDGCGTPLDATGATASGSCN